MKNNNADTYPTKEEYYNRVEEIHKKELKSDTYKTTYNFLKNVLEKRQYIDLENELFKIVGTYGLEDNLINESAENIKMSRIKRFNSLTKFLNSLTKIQLESNIYLSKTKEFFDQSLDNCKNIINQLYKELGNNKSKFINLKAKIPENLEKNIPKYISNTIGIKYYDPNAYKISHINVLDDQHAQVYEEYNNSYVFRISKIVTDIYLLQLNNLISNSSHLTCDHFQIYNDESALYVTFYIKECKIEQENVDDLAKKNGFTNSKNFIDKTVDNFKKLLDMGVIDTSILYDKKFIITKK